MDSVLAWPPAMGPILVDVGSGALPLHWHTCKHAGGKQGLEAGSRGHMGWAASLSWRRWTEEVRMRTRECVTVAEVIHSLKKENDRLRVINDQLKAQCEAKGASLTV